MPQTLHHTRDVRPGRSCKFNVNSWVNSGSFQFHPDTEPKIVPSDYGSYLGFGDAILHASSTLAGHIALYI